MSKARVDAYQVLKQLRSGMTPITIAREQGVSRQAINLWRRRFVEEGLLVEPKKGRPKLPLLERINQKLLNKLGEMEYHNAHLEKVIARQNRELMELKRQEQLAKMKKKRESSTNTMRPTVAKRVEATS